MSLRGAKRRSNLTNVKRRRLLRQHFVLPRNDMLKRIGLFGGTFNPVHIGHIKMAEAARKEYKLSYVYFIPCGIPPHKSKKELLPAKLRYKLVSEAIKGKKHFKILDIEIKKKKPAYTINTVLSLRGALATKQSSAAKTKVRLLSQGFVLPCNDVELYFLIGQDEFEKLHTWNKANELAKLITFLVLPRVGARPMCLPKPSRIKGLKWHLVHTKPINISSTEIRKKIKIKSHLSL